MGTTQPIRFACASKMDMAEKTAHEGGELVLANIHHDQAIAPMPQPGNIETRIAGEKTKMTLLAEEDDDFVVLHPFAPDVDANLLDRHAPCFH